MGRACKKLVMIVVFFLMIGTSLTAYAYNIELGEKIKEVNTNLELSNIDIIIPDDFDTIQQGIDNANPGDIILIKKGIYKENLIINKTGLILQGEDKYNTVLDGCKIEGEGIIIDAENVTVKKLTIKNYKNLQKDIVYSWDQAGIEIRMPNITITDNRFIENGLGIEVFVKAYNATITNNEMINDGILLVDYFSSPDFPDITPNDFLHNITNNTVNGKPLYYFKNKKDFTVPSDAGQITMINCTNFTIKDIHMSYNDFSIILAFCSNSLIENLTITDTTGEILLFACENNTIQYNTISNTFKAICLEFKSKNNIIRYNDLSNNYVGISLFTSASNNTIYQNKIYDNFGFGAAGIEIVSFHGGVQQNNNITENQIYNNPIGIRFRGNSIKNTIYHNNITKNKIGIYLEKSSDHNKITYNNFRKNTVQAFFYGCSDNTWENNYWNRPRILPKLIFGIVGLNFDKNPALKPYDI